MAKFSTQNNLRGLAKFVRQNRGRLLIGYLSYDLAYELHGLRTSLPANQQLPQIYFLAFDTWRQITQQEILTANLPTTPGTQNFKPKLTLPQYQKIFRQIQTYLRMGEIYQINFTHPLTGATDLSARTLFAKILAVNPIPNALYLEGENFEILSFSPESFLKIQNNQIETRPIKGTAARTAIPAKDLSLKKSLQESPKEKAELNMITDLLRNDLNQVCRPGSVQLTAARLFQKCPQVWHTYSRITGTLATSPLAALLKMFPGGSVTGCPKKRALEIIEELESQRRGLYTGAIGQIDPQGNLDFRIAIRTIIKKQTRLSLQVGSGIVIDSTAEAEFAETLQKAKPFLQALA